MAENILLWSSYLMIVVVTFLCLDGIQTKAVRGTGKKVGRCLFTYILPVVPVIFYVLLYLLVTAPQSVEKLNLIEMGLFNRMIEPVAAGVSVILFFWVLAALTLGMRYLHQATVSMKSGSG